MSFNENGQNENQNWKIQNQPRTQHKYDSNIKSRTDFSDVNAASENVGNNKGLKNSDPGDAYVRSGVATIRTDFSGLFTSKCIQILKIFSMH